MKLEDRMKNYYENRTKQFLNRRTITVIRLDGKGFSKLTKNLNKPFDDNFSDFMDATAVYLCENIQGAKFAYTQSDEITIVLTDFDNIDSQAWFDYNIQKMTSIAASLATAKFNQLRLFIDPNAKLAHFDARVFQVPNIQEMANVIIWRQIDCTRNSISMAASANFPHKSLEGKTGDEKQEMLFTEKGINWNDYKVKYKRGSIIKRIKVNIEGPNGEEAVRNKWVPDLNTPIFTQDIEYLYGLIPISE